MAGIISQSSHQKVAWVSRRAVKRRVIAMTARQKVAMLTPRMRGTWLADRSVPGGGPSITVKLPYYPQKPVISACKAALHHVYMDKLTDYNARDDRLNCNHN